MLESLFAFLSTALVTIISKFPASPFNFDTYISTLQEYLPYINWFIPFQQLYVITQTAIATFFASVVLFIFLKFVVKKVV